MAIQPVTTPAFLKEAGSLLKRAREQKGWSLEDVAKRMGLKAEQIQAIEAGDPGPFRQSAQPILWYARLYAKKLDVHLPELVFTDIQRGSPVHPGHPVQSIPSFLMKPTPPAESVD